MVKIVHASIDENGKISGGQAGDQKKEVCVREWYNKPWSVLLRHPRKEIADGIVEVAVSLANSKMVGYDQSERNTLHNTMKLFNHDYKAYLMSKVLTETDCSAFVTECAIAAGVKTLEYNGNAPTTSTMEKVFKNAGFEVYKQTRYLTSDRYLKKGDILVAPGKHTVIVIEDGAVTKEPENVEFFPKYEGKVTSISYALDDMGIESTKSYRKKIYEANFPDKYEFTAQQNTQMLQKLKSGELKRP